MQNSSDILSTMPQEFFDQFPKATRMWSFAEGTCPFCFKKGYMIFVDRPLQRRANILCTKCGTEISTYESFEKFMKEKPPKPQFTTEIDVVQED